jgi:long-chain fatty acid transport protein
MILTSSHWAADYKLTDKFTVRGGVAYDQSPVSDKFRTARLPDEDRYWIAIGGTYAVTDAISIDAGYTHIFVKDASINEGFNVTPTGPSPARFTAITMKASIFSASR